MHFSISCNYIQPLVLYVEIGRVPILGISRLSLRFQETSSPLPLGATCKPFARQKANETRQRRVQQMGGGAVNYFSLKSTRIHPYACINKYIYIYI